MLLAKEPFHKITIKGARGLRATIAIKVGGMFLLIALLCAGIAFLSITGVQRVQAELESLATRDLQQMTLVDRVLTEMLNMETGVRGFVASSNEFFSDESYLHPYIQGKEAIAQALNNLERLMQTEEERSILYHRQFPHDLRPLPSAQPGTAGPKAVFGADGCSPPDGYSLGSRAFGSDSGDRYLCHGFA